MPFRIWDGASWRNPSFVRRWSGTEWVDVLDIKRWDGAAWLHVWPLVRITARALIHASSATYELQANGVARQILGTTATNYSNEWLRAGAAGDYEARATVTAGAISSGTTGVWQVLSTSRSWTLNSVDTATVLVEIREVSTGAVLTSATIDFAVG